MADFFISYAHADSQFVTDLEDKLASEDMTVWIDVHLRGGNEWKKQIDLQIEESKGVIVVVTPISLASPFVTYEWAYAKGLKKPVVPILLQNIHDELLRVVSENSQTVVHERKLQIHPRLGDYHHIDLTSSNEIEWQKLIVTLREIAQGGISSELMVYWKNLGDPNYEIRKQTIETLEKYQDEQANEVLAKAIAESKLREVRERCALALAHRTNSKDPRVIQGFQELILEHYRVPYATEAVTIISSINTSEAVTSLLKIFTKNTDLAMRVLAAKGLGNLKATSAMDILLECLESDNQYDLIMAAANALAEIGDHRVIEKILIRVKRWITEFDGRPETVTAFRSLVTTLTQCGNSGIEAAFNLIRRDNNHLINPLLFNVLKTSDKTVIGKLMRKKLEDLPASQSLEVSFWRNTVGSALK